MVGPPIWRNGVKGCGRFVFYNYNHITWTDIYLDLIHCLGLYSLLSFLHSDLLIKQHQAYAWWFLRMDLSVSSVVWALLPLRHQCSDYRADRVTSHFVRCTMVSHHPWEEWRSQGLKSPLNGSVSEVSIFPSSVLTHSRSTTIYCPARTTDNFLLVSSLYYMKSSSSCISRTVLMAITC